MEFKGGGVLSPLLCYTITSVRTSGTFLVLNDLHVVASRGQWPCLVFFYIPGLFSTLCLLNKKLEEIL